MRKLLLWSLLIIGEASQAQQISTAKPWTFWWWMGSAVTKEDITAQLNYFSKSGLGGVHIIPIYGVKGFDSENIPFLNEKWLDVMQYTVKEGKRLGLGVDLTTGTGWPFGGPNVGVEMGAQQMSLKNGEIKVEPTRQQVKRAAPGGEGLVLDPFRADGMKHYLERFDTAFASKRDLPRSMYMDSYEAYGANWTSDFEVEFEKRRGYRIKDKLFLLTDTTELSALVRMDYHQTLAELLRERYAHEWTRWSKEKGFMTRYQAHGSPGNLLDLYDESDIPETESFGTSRFPIPGLRVDPDYSINQFGTPNPLAMKFASSAAHFSGKKLVSSETGTWLANHFKVSLSQIKPQIDELFAAGINHIFYHGTNYSPQKESYPGWLFYASTHFGQTSHFAEHFSMLNKYVENCQILLQNSEPDNDILVYFPIHDLWSTPAKSGGGVHLLEVHHVDRWLLGLPFGKLTEKLLREGYTFDFVSDRQLTRLQVDKDGKVNSGNARYKTILVPVSTYMPRQTLDELTRLANGGAKIVFEMHMPDQVTGYFSHDDQQKMFLQQLSKLKTYPTVQVGPDIRKMLEVNQISREELAAKGLTFIRKREKNGKTLYFVSNLGNEFREGWVRVAKNITVKKYDPLFGESSVAHRSVQGKWEVYLTLLPGQSCFLREGSKAQITPIVLATKNEHEIKGEWLIDFLKGKPSLPVSAKMNELKTWSALPDSAVYFSGTARYSIKFDIPNELLNSQEIVLELGDVREVAMVKINGRLVGTAWSIPFQLGMSKDILKAKDNLMEIEVTNLSANYMRLRDRQQPDWKKFKDINIVDITYKKFDASKWEPMPSGLLGPVKILYK